MPKVVMHVVAFSILVYLFGDLFSRKLEDGCVTDQIR